MPGGQTNACQVAKAGTLSETDFCDWWWFFNFIRLESLHSLLIYCSMLSYMFKESERSEMKWVINTANVLSKFPLFFPLLTSWNDRPVQARQCVWERNTYIVQMCVVDPRSWESSEKEWTNVGTRVFSVHPQRSVFLFTAYGGNSLCSWEANRNNTCIPSAKEWQKKKSNTTVFLAVNRKIIC